MLDIKKYLTFKNLEISNDKRNYFEITIHDLTEGKYGLILNQEIITIEIHDGNYWENMSNFIMEKNQLCDNYEVRLPIYMNNLVIDKTNSETQFSLKNQLGNPNIH